MKNTMFLLVKTTLIIAIALWGNSCKNPSQDIQNSQEAPATTFYFIRHAEKEIVDKGERNPDLSSAGLQRTKKWVNIFKHIQLNAIYSTNYKRTLQTAEPIAEDKMLDVEELVYPETPYEVLIKRHKGQNVLFVGHSNTTPEMVNYFLGEDRFQQLDENDYGSLFAVTLTRDNSSAIRLNLN